MSAPYRIVNPDSGVKKVSKRQPQEDFNSYLDRLTKMIPTPVIALYLVGISQIPADQRIALVVWAVICLIGVIVLMVYGTADPKKNKSPDWIHIAISAGAFLIWVYAMGGPFAAYNLQVPFIGSLAVLAYTFFVPIFYKGPID
jgi:small-conductance mechanosensitive channel